MNIDARIAKRFLRPLSHPSLMLARWSARSVRVRILKSRYLALQAACPAVQAVHPQEPFPAVHPNPAFPEHDIPGARSAPFIYKGCQLIDLTGSPFFIVFAKMIPSVSHQYKRIHFFCCIFFDCRKVLFLHYPQQS